MKATIGGTYRPVRGPLPQPRPRTSNSIVQRIAFSKAMGVAHQSPMSLHPWTSGARLTKTTHRQTYTAILAT